jgi:hypothetical protein
LRQSLREAGRTRRGEIKPSRVFKVEAQNEKGKIRDSSRVKLNPR